MFCSEYIVKKLGITSKYSGSLQAMLYDDCEKLLGIKILKNDDDVKTGETLPFDSYLVDIGDPHGDYKPIPKLNTKLMNKKVPVESGLLHSGKSSAAVGTTQLSFFCSWQLFII